MQIIQKIYTGTLHSNTNPAGAEIKLFTTEKGEMGTHNAGCEIAVVSERNRRYK